jgi:phosphoglycerate dehydrogenase-like enzyme
MALAALALASGCRESAPPREARPTLRDAPHESAPRADAAAGSVAPPAAEGDPSARPRIVMEVDAVLFTRAHALAVAESVPEVNFTIVPRDSVRKVIGAADAFVGSPTPPILKAGRRLRWIQTQTGGVDQSVFPELRDSPIVLTSAKIVKGPAMADHAMGLLLALTRQIWRGVEARQRGDWPNGAYQPIELYGKTALIVGLGGAGTQIAERAFASGMRVIATDPKDIPIMRAVERVERPERLAELIPLADVIFVAAPLTEQTQDLFGERAFARMKRGVFFVNVSRGGLVDTDALVRALRDGRVAGAGLDVVDPEPLPADHPLWKMENVVVTPHVAGRSDDGPAHRSELIIENARRFARGLPLRNVANKSLGY